jgi:thiosulfate/3-mercaptopyruvate sulfurtransferase
MGTQRDNVMIMKSLPIGILLSLAVVVAAADLALIQPKDLAAQLRGIQAKPAIFQVGPNVLYRSKHIPGALFAGPGSGAAGQALLKEAVTKLPKDREIVIYCGCCPWNVCPNIKPAMDMLKQMGYTKVKALYLPQNFKSDWIDQNFPVGQ